MIGVVAKPEMAERFTGWDQFGGFAWARILSRRTEFADHKNCCGGKSLPLISPFPCEHPVWLGASA